MAALTVTLCLLRQVSPLLPLNSVLMSQYMACVLAPSSHNQVYRYLGLDMETLIEGVRTGLLGPTRGVNLPGEAEEGVR